jgi:hypothetical protein
MNDDVRAALGITAIVVTVQEHLPVTLPPYTYRIMRASLAVGAPFLIRSRQPWQRVATTALGVWGAAELLQLGYSTLLMGADALLINNNQRFTRRR